MIEVYHEIHPLIETLALKIELLVKMEIFKEASWCILFMNR